MSARDVAINISATMATMKFALSKLQPSDTADTCSKMILSCDMSSNECIALTV